jgi:DNA-binding transcriptional LysR family regulator
MNVSNINLNLLRILAILLSESHVTRAGEKIGLTQSAMSNALKQLRGIYQDELLIRGRGGKMRLTPLAESLRLPVRQALEHAEHAFTCTVEFDPKTSRRNFHIGMSDYIEFVLLTPLIKKISQLAPKCKIIIHHLTHFSDATLLANNQLDLVIGHFPRAPTNLMVQRLFSDSGSFVSHRNHPITKKPKIDLQDILAYPLIMVSFTDDPAQNYLDDLLIQHGYPAQVDVSVPHATIALQALKNTTFITHTVKRIAAPIAKQARLTLLPQPRDLKNSFKQQKYIAYQYWHKIVNNEHSHIWLRKIVKEISDEV